MKREHWVNFFQKLPDTMHDQVVFSLSTGIDVFNQRFLVYADEYLIIRGRLGGTDESERIFMVPWEELKMVFFSRPVEDEMLVKTFGEIIGGVRKSLGAKSREEEEKEQDRMEDDEQRPEPVRLPAASLQALAEASAPKQPPVNMSELRSRLLQPRKPPPNVQSNKPGPGTKPSGK
ncbi:MAG: hypothetical protein QM703_29900 [Gemmatales bacterium]